MAKSLILGASSGIGAAFREQYGLDWDAPPREVLDVGNRKAVEGWFANWGPYDQVVYSVGINYLEWIGKLDTTEIDNLTDANYLGFLWVLDVMVKFQHEHPARIVVVGSDAAERPMRTSIAYCASKAALHMAVRVAARELGPKGWRINAVAPGMTDHTGMQEYVDARVMEVRGWTQEQMLAYEEQQAVVPGRIQPIEVAHTIYDTLMGPDHLNGSIIFINGGR